MPSQANGEWTHYAADMKGTRFMPLDQINAANFNKLEVAWRFKTDNLGPRPEYKLEGTPLMVKGVVYTTAGTRRSVVALDAKTGEQMWVYSMREGRRAAIAPRQLSGRGVSYWTDGKGDERILFITTGFRLVALNAKTGTPIQGFGRNGILDLKEGVVYGSNQPIDLETGEIGLHSTATVAKDMVIVGSSFKEGLTVKTHNNTKGLVRAFYVCTGKKIWQFNTIPRPGEVGAETWENDSWAVNGNTGVWTGITVDEELGLVFLPVETPSSDLYGGHRPGNNLFAESLVCVDLRTGQRKWHYQVVHHPIWDHDLSSPAIVADITVNGRAVKAVAMPSKQAFLYVFDRVTGQPVWPIEEKPMPKGDVPGEWYPSTQPIPTKPPAYSRNYLKMPDDLIDFTPALRQQALENMKRYKVMPEGMPYNPPILGKVNGLLGAINIGNLGGGTNWPGGSYDPETHTAFVQAANAGITGTSLVAPPAGFSDIRYVMGVEGAPFIVSEGPGFGTAADAPQPSPEAARPPAPSGPPVQTNLLNVEGLPIMKPPYGVVAAINLDRGEMVWQVPHGDTPDAVRNHPALKGINVPKTGQSVSVGLTVTRTLVIVGDGQVTNPGNRPRGAMLRAYDKASGKEVGAVYLPAPQSGSPMTYSVDGKQYIIVAVSGGAYSGEYIAFALPDSEIRASGRRAQ
ncbi:MAG: quinoprotein glucose dehydrogenase [Acidobacteria bacterium]|nr:MAG: quinoprotein glucose dehydrogenase [Acidobacteriota bacterium]